MPISAPFHGLSTKLYAKVTAPDLGTVVPADLVGEVSEVGTLELSANVIEYNSYNNLYKRKLVGQRDSGTLDINVNWIPDAATEATQGLLKDHYDSGVLLYFALYWEDASGAQAAASFSGFVSSFSVSQPVEEVVTANVQIAIDGAVTMDLDGTFA